MAYSKEQKVAAYNWIVEYDRLYEMDQQAGPIMSNGKEFRSPWNAMSEMQVRLTNGCQQRRRAVNRWFKHEEGSREGQEWFAELKAAAEGLILVEADPSESVPVMRLPMFRAGFMGAISDRPYECEADKQIDEEAEKAVFDFWASVGVGAKYWQCNKNHRHNHWTAFAARTHKLVEDGELALAEYYIKVDSNYGFPDVPYELKLRLCRYYKTLEAGLLLVTDKTRDVFGHFVLCQWDGSVFNFNDGTGLPDRIGDSIKGMKRKLIEVREHEVLKLKAKAWDDLHSNNGRTGPMTFDRQDLEFIWKGLALLSKSTERGFNVGMAFEREFEELQIQIDCAIDNLDRQNEEESA